MFLSKVCIFRQSIAQQVIGIYNINILCIYRDRWLAIVFKLLSGSPQGPPPPPPPPPNGPDDPPPPPPPPGMTAAHRTNNTNQDKNDVKIIKTFIIVAQIFLF